MITDFTGKSLEALKVISHAIGYFKYLATNNIKELLKSEHERFDEDIYFVLTVPTTWGDKEMDFMRTATIMVKVVDCIII